VVIVEQGQPAAAALCAQLGVEASVIADSERGASRARNVGARCSHGDALLFTDDDCVVPETWVRDHLDALADGTVDAAFGAVTGLSRTEGADPTALSRVHRHASLPWHVGHGSNMAVRRSAFDAVGGWDDRLGPGTGRPAGEDADLIVRLLAAGFAVRSGVGSPVVHMDWRTGDEQRRNLQAYDLGAGVWIGKVLRTQGRRIGLRYVRARRRLFADRRRQAEGLGARVTVFHAMLTFVRGLVRGYRLAAPGETARQAPARR
jgi:GT2 family glycosyltransferase